MDGAPTPNYFLKPETYLNSKKENSQISLEIKDEIILDKREYKLTKDDITYNISINKTDELLLIRCLCYEIKLTINDLTKLTKIFLDNLNDGFKFIIDIFENDKVIIEEVEKNKMIKLKFIIFDYAGRENLIDVELLYNSKNKEFEFEELTAKCESYEKEISNLKSEISELKKEVIKFNTLKNELHELKSLIKEKGSNKIEENKKDKEALNKESVIKKDNKEENKNITSKGDMPQNINFIGELCNNSYNDIALDYTFTVFNSKENIAHLVYATNDYQLIFLDLTEMKLLKKIEKAHSRFISNIHHFYDDKENSDIIMTASYENNNIKLWDLNTYDSILNIKRANVSSLLLSVCFLKYNNTNCIVSSNGDLNTKIKKFSPIKLFDFKGNAILEINDSNYNTNFITTYYDSLTSQYFVITGNDGFINSYNLMENSFYLKFCDNETRSHRSLAVYNSEQNLKLIDSCEDGIIRIYNFYTGKIIKRIFTGFSPLRGICIWDKDCFFIGCKDKTFKLVDTNKGIVIKSIKAQNSTVLTVKKINLPKYGNCLVSQGMNEDNINLWSVN